MFIDLIEKLRCPVCGEQFEIADASNTSYENEEILEGSIVCNNDHIYQVHDGVLDFNSEEQEAGNNWSQMYEKYDYNELDDLIMSNLPKVQKDGYKKSFEWLIDAIEKNGVEWVVDVATGRGMLAIELVKHFGNNLNMICTDLSFLVLKYDRLKCLEINPEMKVNFIACDATAMPLVDDCVDLSVSFCGIANMGKYAEAGVMEAHRVSAHGIMNVGILIRDNNPFIKEINNAIKEAGYDLTIDSATESYFSKLHNTVGSNYVVENIYEGIAEEVEGDLVPIKGEWFSMAVGQTIKALGVGKS